MRSDRIVGGTAVAASLLLHGLWALHAPAARAPGEPPLQAIELSFEAVSRPETEPEPVAQKPQADHEDEPPKGVSPPAPVKRESPAAVARTREPRPSAKAPEQPQLPREPEPASTSELSVASLEMEMPAQPAQDPQPPSAASPALPDLSPAAVARVWVPAPLTESRTCRPHGGAQADACRDEPAADTALAVQRELDASLKAAAGARPHLAPRPAPTLVSEADGGYSYKGPLISARIAPDGHVNFSETLRVKDVIRGSFDVQGAIEKHVLKQEQFVAEKRWFLEHTEAARTRLADAARTAELAQAKRLLERELEGILRGPSAASEKRAAVFELWAGCSDDRDASAMRKVVEAFVSRHMSEGSALGYASEELERLNRGRSGSARFDPYGRSTPG